jgi:uncharacterized protein (UPF0264 family)
MQLLVSVASAVEARAALAGGADIVDAKDPRHGALGAVSIDVLRQIRGAVGAARPVSAAIGDAVDEGTIERTAFEYAAAGAAFVKVGFGGIADAARVAALARSAQRGAAAAGASVVLVSYVDADRHACVGWQAIASIAACADARGVLLDTADKNGPGIRGLVDFDTARACAQFAHDHGLFIACAGKLTLDDLAMVRGLGADIAGVRGAACEGGRTGQVSAARVRALRAAVEEAEKGCSVGYQARSASSVLSSAARSVST